MQVKAFVSGTLESGDVIITLKTSDHVSVTIQSAVQSLYGDLIRKTVDDTLAENKVRNVEVFVNDNGARDFVIRARLLAALEKKRRGDSE
jgi:citrate lyase subunit gamma (acyl carrier protein)